MTLNEFETVKTYIVKTKIDQTDTVVVDQKYNITCDGLFFNTVQQF